MGGEGGDGAAKTGDMTGAQFIASVAATAPFATALVAGGGVMLLMGANSQEAVSFGAIAALGRSLGDTIALGAQQYIDLDTMFSSAAKYDPQDIVFTGLTTGLIQYAATGMRGEDLYKIMAIAGVAGVLAPSLGAQIHDALLKKA